MMVSRYLREAEQRGLVTVHVKTQWPMDMQLGKRLMEAYGLQECIVLAPNEGDDVQYVLGGFLADYFTSLVKPGMIVGISWQDHLQVCGAAALQQRGKMQDCPVRSGNNSGGF